MTNFVEPGEVKTAGEKRHEPRCCVQLRLQLVLVEKSTQPRVVVEQEDAEEPETDLRGRNDAEDPAHRHEENAMSSINSFSRQRESSVSIKDRIGQGQGYGAS